VEGVVRDVLNAVDRARGLQLYVAPTFVDHSPWFNNPPTLDGWLSTLDAWRAAFPDLVCTQVRLVCEGDVVAYQGTWYGTHQGPFGRLEPTSRRVEVGEHRLFRVHDGRIVEHWHEQDTSGLLRQLGVRESAAVTPSATQSGLT
jgi:predicted ester cyclase